MSTLSISREIRYPSAFEARPNHPSRGVCGACRRRYLSLGLGVFLFAVIAQTRAEPIPALSDVSPQVAAARPDLARQRDDLTLERKILLARTNQHNTRCRAVEEGSAAEASCSRALADLQAAIRQHVHASQRYNGAVETANKHMALSAPHGDSSVVDARNVPSGLSKPVEDAIAGAYANAPPGVAERVRKGFQAVAVRDWPVAKAWFQDALQRDPTNPDLKRLVALADHSPRGAKPSASAPRQPAPAKHTLTSLNANAKKMSTSQIMQALEDIMQDQMLKSLSETP